MSGTPTSPAERHPMSAPISPAVLDQLRKFDTPTICNVLELFEAQPRTAGYMDARIKAWYTQIVELGGPVRVGGVWVNPGDLLHGDRNGVTTIPLHLAAATAEACPEFMAAESVVLEYLKAGSVTPAGYAAARTECQRRIGE